MSYPKLDVFLSKNEQENIRKMLGPVKTISEYLGKAAKYLKEGKGLAKSLAESAPWLKDVAEAAGAATPIVGVAVKLAEKWLEQTLESATSMDAHLGDALCQICAMVHFYISMNEGLERIEPNRIEYVKSERERKYQRHAKNDQFKFVLFAPGGEDVKSGRFNPNFNHYCARINSAFGSPLRRFPSRAILNGVSLANANLLTDLVAARLDFANLFGAELPGANLLGANLNYATLMGANLEKARLDFANLSCAGLDEASLFGATLIGANMYGARLGGANLYNARLNGADLKEAMDLTREQIESAWIDERTRLPEWLEVVKPEILERQQFREKEITERQRLLENEINEIPF